MLYAVYNEPDLSCELAYMLAMHTDKKTLLIDGDTIKSGVSWSMGIKKVPSEVTVSGDDTSSFNIMMTLLARDKNNITGEIIERAAHKVDSLFVLSSNDDLEAYEYYVDDAFDRLLNLAMETFDVVVINVGESLYDSFTMKSLLLANTIIFPGRASMPQIEYFNKMIHLLESRQGIEVDKYLFVPFNYDESLLDPRVLRKLCLCRQSKIIPKEEQRIILSNKLDKAYCQAMGQEMKETYVRLLSDLGIKRSSIFFELKRVPLWRRWLGNANNTVT